GRSQSRGDRKVSFDQVEDSKANNERSTNGQTGRTQLKKTVRCPLDPLCPKHFLDCIYIHPNRKCLDFERRCPRGRDCTFLHPDCENDGNCEDEECAFTHLKQVHARLAAVCFAREAGARR
ncbi:hypothetical protein PFISCL1PPCAC_1144, partial [Pristionchus fissidentatus]